MMHLGGSSSNNSLNMGRRKVGGTGTMTFGDLISDDRFWVVLSFLFIILPWAPYHVNILPHLKYVRSDIARMQLAQKSRLQDLQKTTKKVQKLNAESTTLEEENNALLFDLRDHGDNVDTETNKYREGEEMEETLLQRIDDLQGAIQKRSEEAVKSQ